MAALVIDVQLDTIVFLSLPTQHHAVLEHIVVVWVTHRHQTVFNVVLENIVENITLPQLMVGSLTANTMILFTG